jgi:hypothetical protein
VPHVLKVALQRGNETVHEIQGMPDNLSISGRRGVYDRSFHPAAVAQRDSLDFMAESREPQRQLTKPTEAIVEQILAHVLTLSENENTQVQYPANQCSER